MADLTITRADFEDPRLARFLQAHLDDLAPTAPVESRHALDLGALEHPSVRLWVTLDRSTLVATGATKAIGSGHVEIKSMRTAPDRRGEGLASRMLGHLIEDARASGAQRVSLETGSMEFFAAARALYSRNGFSPCGPFADYRPDPNSVFMTLLLDTPRLRP